MSVSWGRQQVQEAREHLDAASKALSLAVHSGDIEQNDITYCLFALAQTGGALTLLDTIPRVDPPWGRQ